MTVKELYEKVVNGIIISDIELQRAIVYDAEKQALVIDSIYNGIPLPAFYLWQRGDGKLEVLDGKQRIEAIKKFKQGNLQYEGKTWKAYAYDSDLQQVVDNTELTTIICCGTEDKKREIFNRINTLGVPLSKFEVLNGLYHGNYIEGLNDYFAQDANVRKVLPNATVDRGDNKYHLLEYIYYVRNNCIVMIFLAFLLLYLHQKIVYLCKSLHHHCHVLFLKQIDLVMIQNLYPQLFPIHLKSV